MYRLAPLVLLVLIGATPITPAVTRNPTGEVARQEVEPEPATGITLVAPNDCEVGELVRLDARESEVDSFAWTILPATTDFETVDDGRRAFFSSRSPGEYWIFIAGAKDCEAVSIVHHLVVRGIVTDATGLKADVKRWMDSVAEFDTKRQEALSMAGVFRKIATSETKVDEMLAATAAANSAIVQENLDKWIPFLEELGKTLDAFIEAGELQTREQYAAKWVEIADAIEYAVK